MMVTAPPMSQTTLEVTVVSGEEVWLRGGGAALRGGVFAVVHTTSAAARTRVDEDSDCNGYPYWGEAVRVTMPSAAAGLDVEICRATSCGRTESVAAARVPAGDFHVGPPGHLHCLSYRLFDRSSGLVPRRNGIVNITVRRLDGEGKSAAAQPAGGWKAEDAAAPEKTGSCCAVAGEGKPETSSAPAGVAMGYPVVGFAATDHAANHGMGYA